LSQYNGYAIWLRLISDWDGSWLGLNSQYIHTRGGKVNSYGLGTLLHEVLHKNSVGGLLTFSSSERKNLRIYFAPSLVINNPPFNESMLFHESLHGFSGLGDGGVPGQIGLCDVLGATPQTKIKVEFPNCGSSTINITDWIEKYIIAPH
jgi:hypothetical protein